MSLSISLARNGGFHVFIPSDVLADGAGHRVFIPLSIDGLKVLRKLLQDRERAVKEKIGHDSHPTQAQIQAFLVALRTQQSLDARVSATQKEIAQAEKIAAIVPGLDLSGLGL